MYAYPGMCHVPCMMIIINTNFNEVAMRCLAQHSSSVDLVHDMYGVPGIGYVHVVCRLAVGPSWSWVQLLQPS